MAFRGQGMTATLALLHRNNVTYRLSRAPAPFLTWQLFCQDPNGVEVELDFDPGEPAPADWQG